VAAASLASTAIAQDVSTGEYAYQVDSTPALTGQATHDHLFTQNDYNGKTHINKVTFQGGDTITVWFYLDDDEIYQNADIQALTPIAYNAAGDLYNEITYNSFQCELYLPEYIMPVLIVDEDYNVFYYLQGDRLPTSSNISWSWNVKKVVDGKTYDVYMVTCYNTNSFGSHLSAKNGTLYKRNGALKKESSLFALSLMFDTFNCTVPEGRFDQDMIIANQIFTLRETYIAEWDPNDAIFFFGSGGNNESQRFMTYNRVQLYGTNGIAGLVGDVDGDGAVTISDVTALIDYLLAETPIAGDGDIDGNGNISIGDVTTLIDILLTGGSN
jgi:hypothetical protein